MKKIWVILFVTSNIISVAQNISGSVADSLAAPVPYITVALLNGVDSSIYKGTITDGNGKFSFVNISKGKYLIKISGIGYRDKYSEKLTLDSLDKLDLPDITLSTGLNLEEVTVSALKNTIEFKQGNVTVNVENSVLAKGNSVYDLLIKLPGVSIDDGQIKLNGKTGVIIMIDGRPEQISNLQLLNMLKGMSTEVVAKIELLKNPPVKYDALGTGGLINIKTKKTKQRGFHGSLYSSYSQGFYGRGGAGTSLNLKLKRITLFTNIDGNINDYQSKDRFNKKFKTDTTLTKFTAFSYYKETEKALNYKVGADWQLNKTTIVGVKVDGGPGTYASDGTGINYVSGFNTSGFDHLSALVHSPSKWHTSNYNVNAEHQFDTLGTQINFSTDYSRLEEVNRFEIVNLFLDKNNDITLPSNIYRSITNGNTRILSGKLDFTKHFNDVLSLEAGMKISSVTNANNYLFERKSNLTGNYSKDSLLSNNYKYNEQTTAAYINILKSFKKINIQLGCRVENTKLIGENTDKGFKVERTYLNFFPNLSLELTLSKNNTIQFNANRRIDRPLYSELSPFTIYKDQYSYFQGNPFLLPHYSNNVEISHSYKEIITNSLTYTRIDHVIINYTEQNDSTKETKQTIKNMSYNNYFAYSLFIRYDLKEWWNISGNGLISYNEYAGDVNGSAFKSKTMNYNVSLTNTFICLKKTKIELLALYNGAQNLGLIQLKPRWMASLALKRSFYNDKLDCSIGINDIFYTYIAATSVRFNNQDWDYRQTADTRRLTASITYNFGKSNVSVRDVSSSNDEEKGRLSH